MSALTDVLSKEQPLQILGVPNAYTALMAEEVGFKALYLSGAGVANLNYGIPDIGLTSCDQVAAEVKKIADVTKLPLIVDLDTGWEDPKESVKRCMAAGATGGHIEDQVDRKKCGHLDGKQLVSTEEMCARLRVASEVEEFYLIARTDALANEGLEGTIQRALAYKQAGAKAIFAEAFLELEQYQKLAAAVNIPILANMTEFGKTALYTTDELSDAGVAMVLYPLSCSRAMNKAALKVMQSIRSRGTQKEVVNQMQSREELYQFLKYQNG